MDEQLNTSAPPPKGQKALLYTGIGIAAIWVLILLFLLIFLGRKAFGK